MMSDRRILFLTDPIGTQRNDHVTIPDLTTIADEIGKFDLCGRSWAEHPRSWAELVFNTFKPVFCRGRVTTDQMEELLEEIDWMGIDGQKFWKTGVRGQEERSFDEVGLDKSRLVVICSDKAVQDLIGRSISYVYSYHAKRDDIKGEKGPIFLSEIRPRSPSILSQISKDLADKIEIAVLPEPSIGGRRDIKGLKISVERFEELRQDYIRSIHATLGCDRHALW
ncbi:MAG: hypothetical protein HPY73_07355 [Methanomassiliicoccales archaeon]|nr:MAG: hypothetical protein HPY73_07355 [Methanomassiliicoccales archaeon]